MASHEAIMGTALLVDFGSTYTKVLVLDLDKETVLGRTQAVTTRNNIMTGLNKALHDLRVNEKPIGQITIDRKIACSSAAGGLRLIAVGLVPELTLEAARRAALSAGAKVIGAYSHELTDDDVRQIEDQSPDMILLSGGTDGGNKKVIIHNGHMLAKSSLDIPIVVAGNRSAAGGIVRSLQKEGKTVQVTENILPELDNLNIEPARATIREIFTQHIVKAKGLDRATEYIGDIIMPTPMATLNAARLLADGTEDEPGLGDLMVVEVGGATTNIHSIGKGQPTRAIPTKGLPEPYAKRTVEGDLGIRYNAPTILEIAGEDRVLSQISCTSVSATGPALNQHMKLLSDDVSFVPRNNWECNLDLSLARCAVEIATARHVGQVQEVPTLFGTSYIQLGKDLTQIKTVIGTGGVFIHTPHPRDVLEGVLFDENEPSCLKPRHPRLYIDQSYLLYGIGLLGEVAPTQALRIAKKYLLPIS